MARWSSFDPPGSAQAAVASRRKGRGYRHKLQTLAYVNLDQANGGILRDISENGLALLAVAPVYANQPVSVRLDLGPRLQLESAGRIAWSGPMGQAGVEFLDPPPRAKKLLKQYLFAQLLVRAHEVLGAESIFSQRTSDGAAELHFSTAARPTIQLNAEDIKTIAAEGKFPLSGSGWFGRALSAHTVCRLLDGVILTLAVLWFAIVALGMLRELPAWPITFSVLFVAASLFGVAYWLLFVFWIGATPGAHFARLAGNKMRSDPEEDDLPRFR